MYSVKTTDGYLQGHGYWQRNKDENGNFSYDCTFERVVSNVSISLQPYYDLNNYSVMASPIIDGVAGDGVELILHRGNEWIEDFYESEMVELSASSDKVRLSFVIKDFSVDDAYGPAGFMGDLYGFSEKAPPYEVKAGKISTAMTIDEIVKQHNLLVEDIAMINSLIN